MLARALPIVVDSLRSGGPSGASGGPIVQEEATAAVRRGLAAPTLNPDTGTTPPSSERPYAAGHRLVALTLPAPLIDAINAMAIAHFRGDTAAAAGWLLARGTGLRLALPLPPPPPQAAVPPPPAAKPAPRRPAAPRSPQTDVDAPDGTELRERREALKLSQKEVAAAAGLSRGLVAEVERGRRANALTRLRISETLIALERAA